MRCVKLQPILCLKFVWLSQSFFFKLGNSKRFLTSSDLFEECNHCFVFVLFPISSIFDINLIWIRTGLRLEIFRLLNWNNNTTVCALTKKTENTHFGGYRLRNQLDNLGFRGYKRLIVVEFYSGSNVNDIGFSATVYVMDIYNKSIHARVLLNIAIDYLWFLFCFIRRFKWSIPFLFYYRLKHKHWIIKRIERSIISYSPISFIFG